ncbi:hypothetical protein [Mesorhizobium escarrei]|uniref:Uncharacterized protein n=1 Tax=Mesorhizobium escarrei TaxID=666018 RepID=A0ABN8JEI2_9HYPH|nr:hypothetical protein [Mesorhizobium escarrei]CAH2395530.1 conserved exported hypothetical protein [Mesorhizobium escarrei]
MTFRIALCSVLPVLLLVGCANPQQPQDYSPGYSYVSTDTGGSEKGVGSSVLAPNACLNEPADDDRSAAATNLTIVSGVGSHLPPGCANAYNLQRMAESQRDLVEGRRMGAAAAAPTANAARRYLNGEEAPIGGANSGADSGPLTPQTTLPVE